MTEQNKRALLKLARDTIASHFDHSKVILPDAEDLQAKCGVFVSLHKDGDLRGCIGFLRGYKSVVASVVEMANSAAFQDTRFSPVRESELQSIKIEISILSEMLPVLDTSQIKVGQDGLYIQHPHGSGLLLPQVPVEWNWDLPTFLKQICRKAGLHYEAWKDKGAQLFSFTADVFSEE